MSSVFVLKDCSGITSKLNSQLETFLSLSDAEQSLTSAAIREVSQAIGTAALSSNEEKVKELLNKNKLDSPAAPTTRDSPTTTPSRSTTTTATTDKLPSRNSLADSPLRKKKKKSNQEPNKNGNLANRGEEPGGNSSEEAEAAGTHVERRPFDKLFQGVVFVMSGFENPYRKNLRDQAVEMGAKCKVCYLNKTLYV
jgi:DNA-repair protein XRCC1